MLAAGPDRAPSISYLCHADAARHPMTSWADAVDEGKPAAEPEEPKKPIEEWTLVTRGHGAMPLHHSPLVVAVSDKRTLLFKLTDSNEAGFVVGAGGRNTALVFKTTGVSVVVSGEDIWATPRAASKPPDMELARRMALSMSVGGVLRWFVTPMATTKGFPSDRQESLRALAAERGCDLLLLRSKRGHLCLLLVVHTLDVTTNGLSFARSTVRAARDAMLLALGNSPVGS